MRQDIKDETEKRQSREVGMDLAKKKNMAVGVELGYKQQRVHAHIGHGACCERLEVLRAADLALPHHPGVVAHVLRFEGHDFEALAGVVATQGGGEPAFAGAAGGAEHHHTFGGHVILRN